MPDLCTNTRQKCLTFPVQTVRILNLEIWMEYGPVAQLGARFNRTEEVEGSNPSRSIREKANLFSQKHRNGPIAHEVPFPGELGAPWETKEKE